ncbi:MAG TPA: MarR family transcriptional regulator [Deltaproteobacteria bacterium]|nr:MarR family transcriptional regulator [Deltaproteobacteria bacterium]
MIKPFGTHYLSPTKEFRRFSVLLSIHDTPDTSQHTIGKNAHLSSSMVNNYIKQFKGEGLITVSGNTNRTQRYHLTREGHQALRESLLSYSTEIVQLFGSVKQEIAKILGGYYEEGIRTIALFGAAETAEVAHAAIKKTQLVMIGVVDSDPQKQGKPFNGLLIQPPEELKRIQPDAVVITSFARQREIEKSIRQYISKKTKVKKLSELT